LAVLVAAALGCSDARSIHHVGPSQTVPASGGAISLDAGYDPPPIRPRSRIGPQDARLATWQAVTQLDAERAATISGDTWSNVGPSPALFRDSASGQDIAYTGRVIFVATNPTNAQHWLVAADGGGIWKTLDAGTTWTATTDAQVALHATAIAFAPGTPSVVYATVSEDGSGGLLQSTDGGSTWTLRATSPFSVTDTAKLAVDPGNANTIVATTEAFFRDLANTGVFRSRDGGVTFTQALQGRATDLVVDPMSFANQYAAITNCCFDPSSDPSGLFRSSDAGVSWAAIAGPWFGHTTALQQVELAIAPSNRNVVYAAMQYADGTAHIWNTANAWAATPSWTELATPPESVNELVVDPSNSSVVYVGSTQLYRFTGGSYANISRTDTIDGIHVDQRALAWAGGRLVIGNDGGVFSTADAGATWSNHNTNSGAPSTRLSITQFYDGSLHPTNPMVALGGNQDNGSSRWTGTSWRVVTWGDGQDNIFSLTHPDTSWATSSQGLAIARTTDTGATTQAADIGISAPNRSFFGQFDRCPSSNDFVIAATNKVWLTTNFFSSAPGQPPSWTANSPDLPPPDDKDSITRFAFAPSDTSCSTYAFGAGNGRKFITQNRGATWSNLDPSGQIPRNPSVGPAVSGLAFDPTNANVLYLTLRGFDRDHPAQPGHVFKTTNALSSSPTWNAVSPPGSDVPHQRVVVDPLDPRLVYVATDLGVWRSTDGASTAGNWTHCGVASGLPLVAVSDLVYERGTDRLIAFTFGRGAFLFHPAIPAVPTLTGTVGGGHAMLSWTSSLGARSYNVKRGSKTGGPYTVLATVSGTAFNDTAPAGGTNFYVVSAINSSGESANSNEVALQPGASGDAGSADSGSDAGADAGTDAAASCTAATAIDLGAPGTPNTVASNACVRVLNGYPSWWGTNRTMQLQDTTPGTYPVPFTWANACAGSSGSGTYTADFQSKLLSPTSSQCATVIRLMGSASGRITLQYFGQ
jgi:photosystem II stability/assembly factor-like uncharacterized protein